MYSKVRWLPASYELARKKRSFTGVCNVCINTLLSFVIIIIVSCTAFNQNGGVEQYPYNVEKKGVKILLVHVIMVYSDFEGYPVVALRKAG